MNGAEWRVIAASVQGVSHRRQRVPCQDAHCWRTLPGGGLVAAVADGAGSATHAEIGAICAVRAAADSLDSRYRRGIGDDDSIREAMRAALQAALDAIAAEAKARDVESRDLATTLIIVLATRDWVAAAQVGDGAAVTSNEEGDLAALTSPPDSEYANETVFLTSTDASDSVQFALRREVISQIVLFSDGLQRLALKLPRGTPHAPFFAPLLRFAEQADDANTAHERLTAFLNSPRITERTDDDLTLLLATLSTGY